MPQKLSSDKFAAISNNLILDETYHINYASIIIMLFLKEALGYSLGFTFMWFLPSKHYNWIAMKYYDHLNSILTPGPRRRGP